MAIAGNAVTGWCFPVSFLLAVNVLGSSYPDGSLVGVEERSTLEAI
jgi:hypothetical protein